MYSNAVLNLFKNPKNIGRISKPDGIADLFNENNTDHVEFSLRIESGVITESKFRAQANPYIIAICSTITTMLKGKMVSMFFLDPYSIKKELGDESPVNIDFCIECVRLAILDYKEKLEKENKSSKKSQDSEIAEIETTEVKEMVETAEVEEIVEKLPETKIEAVNNFLNDSLVENPSDDDDDFADFFDFLDDV